MAEETVASEGFRREELVVEDERITRGVGVAG
jgi:hypothetical protein